MGVKIITVLKKEQLQVFVHTTFFVFLFSFFFLHFFQSGEKSTHTCQHNLRGKGSCTVVGIHTSQNGVTGHYTAHGYHHKC